MTENYLSVRDCCECLHTDMLPTQNVCDQNYTLSAICMMYI